ncbi:MAG: co-chaperone GroES [Bacteroidales bacterium]|nr:co-chaperone GroES [Bacteroidales bacterium]
MANSNIDNLIVVGDRVLIEPAAATKKTKGGLLLPAGYQEKEEVQTGYILKCGPGYALPAESDGEAWNPEAKEPRYLPLQVKPGDMAIFLLRNAVEIKYDGKKYFIAPQQAILMVERDEF